MARWVLYCRQCGSEFTHSQILDSGLSVRDPFIPEIKPEFPNGGQSIGCPNCKVRAIYQRYQLLYRVS